MSVTAPPSFIIEAARSAALDSACDKSKRGVAAFDRPSLELHLSGQQFSLRRIVVGAAANGQPPGFTCSNSARCRRDCARICMHAEQRAIMQALVHSGDREDGVSMDDVELLHVKVVDGAVVASKGPGCEQCSRLMLDVGVRGIWLFELDDIDAPFNPRYAWRYYDSATFHRETLRNLDLGDHG